LDPPPSHSIGLNGYWNSPWARGASSEYSLAIHSPGGKDLHVPVVGAVPQSLHHDRIGIKKAQSLPFTEKDPQAAQNDQACSRGEYAQAQMEFTPKVPKK
jgi:hypothetical protein